MAPWAISFLGVSMARQPKCEELARLRQEEANAVMRLGIELARLDNHLAESDAQQTEFRRSVAVARLDLSRISAALEAHIALHRCIKIART